MKLFFTALIKSLFGDAANTAVVVLGVLLALLLVRTGEGLVAGWVMAVVLLLAAAWLAGRYAKPKP